MRRKLFNTDLGAMKVEDAREARKADTKHCVDFWSALPAAHGGVQSRNHFYGSMAFGFVHLAAADSKWREVPEQVGRASHKRAVLAPVVVSAIFRTKLLGDATVQQINRLYALTCVASSFSWYVTPRIAHCTHCNGRAAAIAIPHFTGGVVVLGGVEKNTVMCIHSGV